jgi:hypothetical protein
MRMIWLLAVAGLAGLAGWYWFELKPQDDRARQERSRKAQAEEEGRGIRTRCAEACVAAVKARYQDRVTRYSAQGHCDHRFAEKGTMLGGSSTMRLAVELRKRGKVSVTCYFDAGGKVVGLIASQ